jgi:hypothetical protein
MPEDFADLLTTAGLVSLTVLIVALLKAARGPEGSTVRRLTDWVRQNQFLTSLFVAFTIAGIAYLVQTFGYMQLAEEYWQGWLFLWAASQALYNGQKGVSHILEGQPN